MKLVLFWFLTISFFSVAFAVDQPIKHEQLIKDQLTALNTYRKQHKNRPLVECQLEIGRLYFDQGDFLNALDYDLQALNIAEKIHDSQLTLNALSAIGSIFLIQEDFRKAKAYFLAADNKGRNNSSKT
jgi:tetratricopeptide (TPR) repeat protein